MSKTLASLHKYGNHVIKPVGSINVTAELNNRAQDVTFYVVDNAVSTVIGLPTCKHFDIVKVEAVDAHNA